MVRNISNPITLYTNNSAAQTSRINKLNENNSNKLVQKPDVVSGATKKNQGDHYFETRA